MPLVHFTRDRDEIPASAANVRSGAPEYPDLWLYDTHVGLCLFERERNMRDDSDFLMTVWDAEAGQPVEIEFASTRGWSYPSMASRPDATPEVQAAYAEWKRQRDAEIERARAEAEAKMPRRGRTVRVFKGRKVPVGTVGVVGWTGDIPRSRYGGYPEPDRQRIGIDTPNGRVFVNAGHLEVVDPATLTPEAR